MSIKGKCSAVKDYFLPCYGFFLLLQLVDSDDMSKYKTQVLNTILFHFVRGKKLFKPTWNRLFATARPAESGNQLNWSLLRSYKQKKNDNDSLGFSSEQCREPLSTNRENMEMLITLPCVADLIKLLFGSTDDSSRRSQKEEHLKDFRSLCRPPFMIKH